MQAIFSVLAIAGAAGIAFWQHQRDLLRERRKEFDATVAQYNGVLQMVTAVCQLAAKLEKHCSGTEVQMSAGDEDGGPGTPTLLGMDIICTELEVAIEAIARTDLLPLMHFKLIRAMQVAQSSGSVAVRVARGELAAAVNANDVHWPTPMAAAALCTNTLGKLGDELHEDLKNLTDGVFRTEPVTQA